MSSQSASTMLEVQARQQQPFRLLDLPDDDLKIVIDQVVECDIEDAVAHPEPARARRTLMSLSLVNRKLRLLVSSRIFRTVCLLKRGEEIDADTIQKFAAVAQGNPSADSEEVKDIFCRPPVHLFAGTSSLAIHQFWTSTFFCQQWISEGIRKLLQAPRSLRRLHLDGNKVLAKYLKEEMEKLPVADFSTLTEVTISTEMSFLLKYMPNIERLSNKAYTGFQRHARVYWVEHVREFVNACQNLPKLKTLELTLADLSLHRGQDIYNPTIFRIPNLSLETLALSGQAARSTQAMANRGWVRTMPIGGIINLARFQPNLVELHMPWHAHVTLGPGEYDDWQSDPVNQDYCHRELMDMLPAALVAAKVPGIKRIQVGRHSMVQVIRDQGQLRLKLSRIPVSRLDSREVVCWFEMWDHWKEPVKNRPTLYPWKDKDVVLPVYVVEDDPDERAASFMSDENVRPTGIVVNLNNPRIDMLQY